MKGLLRSGAALLGLALSAHAMTDAPGGPAAEPKKAKARKPVKAKATAADPGTPSRQVRRATERRSGKMPLRIRQAEWHRILGLPVSRRMEARGGR